MYGLRRDVIGRSSRESALKPRSVDPRHRPREGWTPARPCSRNLPTILAELPAIAGMTPGAGPRSGYSACAMAFVAFRGTASDAHGRARRADRLLRGGGRGQFPRPGPGVRRDHDRERDLSRLRAGGRTVAVDQRRADRAG